MLFVGRLIRNADGQKCDDGGDQVEPGVQCFGQDAQAVGADHQKRLEETNNRAETTLSSAARFFSFTPESKADDHA